MDKEVFIRSFFRAKENTIQAKNRFGSTIELSLLVKNIDNTDSQLKLNIQAEELDRYVGQAYTEADLKTLLL